MCLWEIHIPVISNNGSFRFLKALSRPVAVTGLMLSGLVLASCSAPTSGGADKVSAALSAPVVSEYQGTPARVRRISSEKYANTVKHIFGNDIEVGSPFAPLRRTDGLLSAGAASAGVTLGELQQIQRTASAIASQVIDKGNIELGTPARRDFLIPCSPAIETAADDACAEKFIRPTARLLYRRTLPDEDISYFVEEAHKAAESLDDFYLGLASVLEGMLMDPKVILIADTTELDPDDSSQYRLDAYALASRLSFFLWNAGPDHALLDAAEAGELFSREGRARVIDWMLASPRVEEGMRAFFDDMLDFEKFGNLAKDAEIYPMVTGVTLRDAREQTLRTIMDLLFEREADYRDLFTTRETFMSPALATVYQIPTTPGWVPYEFPEDSPRIGLLTQISFLTLNAHPARSSPTYRGKALREVLLCQPVPRPPPNVDFSVIENPKLNYATQRDRVNAHLENPVCAGCHKITDPMGLALENFDGAGRFRAMENGTRIDTSGSLDGVVFDTVEGLAQALRDHPALPSCLVNRMYSYGTGGPLSKKDNPAIKALTAGFEQSGYNVPDLVRMIVMNDAFYEIVTDSDSSQSAAMHAPTAQSVAAN